ncbi:MAG: tetratricopeptide repeat protein [Prevotella sp.]|jgi:tetratricopeptide (TPR) repeat protein|nr:tetratricopeptide repeat protein [Prevotella sp.]MBR3388981.1 tetratricopeptide repeat protein [Prevotella sp.]
MDITTLIKHPETMSKETLYQLRELTAQYPYYQTARLLMLQNLYLLHDSSFDEELRRAAVYITDRRIIFNLVEASHYAFKNSGTQAQAENKEEKGSRSISLIDDFLNSLPEKDEPVQPAKRKPNAADATIDYVAYLLAQEDEEKEKAQPLIGQPLIDNFINQKNGKIDLKETPEYLPELEEGNSSQQEGLFTETLARIYIKQGRFEKALEIIQRLNLNYPKKNAYFADQIRFLEKLIINNKNK